MPDFKDSIVHCLDTPSKCSESCFTLRPNQADIGESVQGPDKNELRFGLIKANLIEVEVPTSMIPELVQEPGFVGLFRRRN